MTPANPPARTAPRRAPPDRAALLIFALALALRTAWVAFRWAERGAAFEFDDEHVHWQLARNLVEHGRLVTDDGRHAARMPLYPLYLSLFVGLGEVGVLAARLGQALLSATAAAAVFAWTRRAAGPSAGLLAGGLACLDPYSIFFCNLLLTETLFIPLAVGLAAVAWRSLDHGTPGGWRPAVGGALAGAVVLTRPEAAGWIVLLWLATTLLAADRRRAAASVLVGATLVVAALLPWALRNRLVLGEWLWLSANGGVTLYDGQGPQADGSSDQSFLHEIDAIAALDEPARDRWLGRAALEHVRRDPARAVRLAWVKLTRTWSPRPNYPVYRTGAAGAAGAAFTVASVGLAAAGAWRVRRRAALLVAALLPIAYFTLLSCVFIGSVRYRVPLMPFVEVLAGCALAERARRLRGSAP